ncbi:MAG: dihydrofolate reductase [Treponema sp.]|nr:dihydrofolate reductase [Treponema sp.]
MNKQEIILIAAVSENGVIGKDNAMPWSVKGNLTHFKETTMGWPCIMGRKTWESLPKKPLPGRLNIVISKTLSSSSVSSENSVPPCEEFSNNVKIYDSLSTAIESCADYEKIFICGGESIYTQSMEFANKIILTLIPGDYEGDTYFPKISESWKITGTIKYENFSIVTYTKEYI